eukprot:589146-Pyramimonas_sp.AAC.1
MAPLAPTLLIVLTTFRTIQPKWLALFGLPVRTWRSFSLGSKTPPQDISWALDPERVNELFNRARDSSPGLDGIPFG